MHMKYFKNTILTGVFLFALACQDRSSKPDVLKVNVDTTLSDLEYDEDTDQDKKITIEDTADKVFEVKTKDGNEVSIESTYHLSNLLQELARAKNEGLTEADIKMSRVEEEPADRISRLIKT
mgnify:CR=1 FL=1